MIKKTRIYFLDNRLRRWGTWIIRCIEQGIGYPSETTESRAYCGSRSTAPLYPPDNPDAEEINDIILHMRAIHPEYAEIINIEYTDTGSQREKIKRLEVARVSYQRRLNEAKTWVESALEWRKEFGRRTQENAARMA